MKGNGVYLYLFLFLTALTWFLGDPYDRVKHSSASETTLQENLSTSNGWEISGDESAVFIDETGIKILNTDGVPISAVLTFSFNPSDISDSTVFRLAGTVNRLSSAALTKDRSKQTIVHAFWKREGQRNSPYGAVRFTGQLSRSTFSFVSVPGPSSDSLQITFASRVPGEWLLTNLELIQDKVSDGYQFVRIALITLWCLLAFRALFIAIELFGLRPAIAVIAVSGLIVLGVSLAQPIISYVFMSLFEKVASAYGLTFYPHGIFLSKVGHALIFSLLTGVLLACRNKMSKPLPVVKLLAFCFILACASEAFQRHVFSRSAQWSDVLIDSAGIGIAVLVWWLCILYQSVRKSSSSL